MITIILWAAAIIGIIFLINFIAYIIDTSSYKHEVTIGKVMTDAEFLKWLRRIK